MQKTLRLITLAPCIPAIDIALLSEMTSSCQTEKSKWHFTHSEKGTRLIKSKRIFTDFDGVFLEQKDFLSKV